MRAAADDLADAKIGLAYQRYKWSTIQGYYAMFHTVGLFFFRQDIERKVIFGIHYNLMENQVRSKMEKLKMLKETICRIYLETFFMMLSL